MKTIVKNLVLFLSLIFIAASCSKDDDNNGGGGNSNSRNVKYEITGDYIGDVQATYTNASNGASGETSTTRPWTKELTVGNDVRMVVLSGSSGSLPVPSNAGKTLTLKIYVGGNVVKNETITANPDGIIVGSVVHQW